MTSRRGWAHGPYEGSLSDKCIVLIESSPRGAAELGEVFGKPPFVIQHYLRTHVRSGVLSGGPSEYVLTPKGRQVLARKSW